MSAKPSIRSFARALRAQWAKYLTTAIVTALLMLVAAFLPDQIKFVTELILAAGILIVTYKIWAAEHARVIELEKIDRTDLEHMLGGRFIDRHTFMYGGEINLCKDYKGPVQIEHLKIGFDTVPVRAPKNSVAGIMVRLNHRRGANQYIFEYRDGNGNVTSITDPYEVQHIYLDAQSCFGLRLTLSEDFELDENSLVRVSVQTWAK
jgi:hypothetical protein